MSCDPFYNEEGKAILLHVVSDCHWPFANPRRFFIVRRGVPVVSTQSYPSFFNQIEKEEDSGVGLSSIMLPL
jgi:hypothetical protein